MKSRFSIIFIIMLFFSIGSCERKSLPDFTEIFERWGMSFSHPKFEKQQYRGFLGELRPTYRKGILIGNAKDHTLHIVWHLNFIRSDEPEDESSQIKKFLSSRVDAQRKRWIDSQRIPDDISNSPKDSSIGTKKREIKMVTGDFKWEERKDFTKDSSDYFTSPMNHRVFYQTWSYVDTTDKAVHGVTSVWCCRQSNRMLTLTISNKYNNNVALLKKYLEDFKCHGIKP